MEECSTWKKWLQCSQEIAMCPFNSTGTMGSAFFPLSGPLCGVCHCGMIDALCGDRSLLCQRRLMQGWRSSFWMCPITLRAAAVHDPSAHILGRRRNQLLPVHSFVRPSFQTAHPWPGHEDYMGVTPTG
ncbi:hypothetical protein XENOCAPTIV_015280 [Xenoophorus captivus]|uniref:Uncharacterized protein n=1 Tax=Xenoophorus captivus TaxID=1517983 RepID=A0ABV0RHG6_9TELE